MEEAFEAAFGDKCVTPERVGLALEQYLLTLVSADSRYDRWKRGEIEFTEAEYRGWELFFSKKLVNGRRFGAGCFRCHGPPTFGSSRFLNSGLTPGKDKGRGEVSGDAKDDFAFRVPSLRNLRYTAPYMHDGRFGELDDVFHHYFQEIVDFEGIPEEMLPYRGGLKLSDQEKRELIAFLDALNDPYFAFMAK